MLQDEEVTPLFRAAQVGPICETTGILNQDSLTMAMMLCVNCFCLIHSCKLHQCEHAMIHRCKTTKTHL